MRALIINSMFVNALYRRCAEEIGKIPGVDLTVFTTDKWMMNDREMRLDPVGVDAPYHMIVGKTAWQGKENRGFYLRGLARAFRHSRPEVIFLMEEPFSIFALEILTLRRFYAPKAPVVFFTWTNLSLIDFDYRPSRFYRSIAKLNLPHLNYALTANSDGEAVLREVGFKGQVKTIGFGVDTEHYSGVTNEMRDQVRSSLGIDKNAKLVGYVGRMLHMKGLDLLIDAFAELAQDDPTLRLLFVGSGEHEAEILDRAKTRGIADRLVHRPTVPFADVPAIMAAIDVFVLPSRRVNMWAEQFGRVLVEAMAAGTLVLGSSSGAIPEVIGNAGLTFKENDSADLKRQLSRMLTMPADEKAAFLEHGRVRATEHFCWPRFAKDAEQAMSEVLAESRKLSVA